MPHPNTFRELYRQAALPLFQNRLYESREEARSCPTGDIYLVEDLTTGLVRNAAFDSTLMNYDKFYNNEQGLSPYFKSYMDDVANLIEQHIGRDRLVEVGCGKGAFLEMMLARGADLVGYDPTYEGTNPRVRKQYFAEELGIRGDGLILRHVLEHINDPVSFLFRLSAANGNRGLVYIEVPCLDWICATRSWFDIFYEHVNYFRLSDFSRMFGSIVYADRSFDGQYLRVIADLSTLRQPSKDQADLLTFPADFTRQIMLDVAGEEAPSIIWGGGSKGVIFSLLRERAGRPVDRVIDVNPSKQGRFLPGTGLQVMSPEEGLAGVPDNTVICVMNPNYILEVKAVAGPRFVCKGMKDD